MTICRLGRGGGLQYYPTTSSPSQRVLKKLKAFKTSSVLKAIARATRQQPSKRRQATDYPEFDAPVRKIFRAEEETVMPSSSVSRAIGRIARRTKRGTGKYRKRKFRKGYSRSSGFYGRFGGASGEDKFFDTTNSFNFDATGEVPATGQLVLIPQGVTESSRVGRKCTITSIQIKGSLIFIPAAAATAATNIFLFLIQDTQCNGAAAANADVFTGANLGRAFHNLSNSSRFKILKKWVITMVSQAGAATALNNVIRYINYFKRCNIPIEYSSTTGAITEIRSNNIFLMAGTAGQSDDTCSFEGATRVRFSDR